jgi:monoterpene epsilon-lactone hydrolase
MSNHNATGVTMNRTPSLSSGVVLAVAVSGFVAAFHTTPALGGDFVAPSTISRQAQEALAKFSRAASTAPLPEPGDIEAWETVQAAVEKKRAEANTAVVRKYQPVIQERTLGGVPVLDIKPKEWKNSSNVLVYTHGGAYALYSSRSRLISAVPMAHDTGLRVVSVNYTLAPHAGWKEITSQVVSVIQALVSEGHALGNIAIYGESAGGGLAAGAVLKMRDAGLGMPAAVVLWSPWSDITETGDSYATLKAADPLLYYPKNLKHCADAYAAPADQKHPYVSPVYGDYSKGFPPTLIQAGTKEIFLSNAVRHYQALDTAGIPVKLDLYEGMWHIFQVFNHDLPESKLARKKVSTFLSQQLGK